MIMENLPKFKNEPGFLPGTGMCTSCAFRCPGVYSKRTYAPRSWDSQGCTPSTCSDWKCKLPMCCDEYHRLCNCEKLRELPAAARPDLVEERGLCRHRSATQPRRRAALCSPRHAAWIRTSCARQKQSSASWRRPHHPPFRFAMVVATAHVPQERRVVAPLRQLLPTQPGNDTRPLPPTQHLRPLQQAARLQVLLLHRPGEGLPSDMDGCPRRC
jgi:hypothetical protein